MGQFVVALRHGRFSATDRYRRGHFVLSTFSHGDVSSWGHFAVEPFCRGAASSWGRFVGRPFDRKNNFACARCFFHQLTLIMGLIFQVFFKSIKFVTSRRVGICFHILLLFLIYYDFEILNWTYNKFVHFWKLSQNI